VRSFNKIAYVIISLLLGAVLVNPSTAIAADPPPTMRGTFFQTNNVAVSNVNCDPDGISSFDFTASGNTLDSGSVVEPREYLGTFTESGTVTLGPAAAPYAFGRLLTLEVIFSVQSGTTEITGTKHFTQTTPASDDYFARCLDLPSSFFPSYSRGQLTSASPSDRMSYEATISTDSGTYVDRGSSYMTMTYNDACYNLDCFNDSAFFELFYSSYSSPLPVANPPASVSVTPATAVNEVGQQHCVTATVTDALGAPTANVGVYFTVNGTSTGRDTSSGSAVTNTAGSAQFCYTAQFPGSDTITAVADADNDASGEVGEPSGVASKTYVLPTSTALCQVAIADGGQIIASNGDRAVFGGNAKTKNGRIQGEQLYQDMGPAQAFTLQSSQVLALVCESSQATIYGTGTIDEAGSYFFRIQVDDLSKNGKTDRYAILLSNGYTSGNQQLRSGNITIKQ